MSAELLKRAAGKMRADWEGTTQQDFYDAVADWLGLEAEYDTAFGWVAEPSYVVARTYLGEQP